VLVRHEIAADRLAAFIFGGNAIFTLQNEDTGVHHTYRLQASDKKTFKASVLAGLDNESNYVLVGVFSLDPPSYRHVSKECPRDHRSVNGVLWLLRDRPRSKPRGF
jgi:hypothetical protein